MNALKKLYGKTDPDLDHMKPGWYPDLPNADYHRSNGISKSGLSLIKRSPLHYWSQYLDPCRPSKEPTPAMVMGSLCHTMILEPDKLQEEYVVRPDVDRRTKAGKAEHQRFLEGINGRQIIDSDQLMLSKRIAEAVMSSPAAALLQDGQPEQSLYWHDAETGELAKTRPDYIRQTGDGFVAIDLKSTDNADTQPFMRTCANFGYELSAAMTAIGVEAVTDKPLLAYKFLVFERQPPHAVAIYELAQTALERGREMYRQLMDRYSLCRIKKEWPGYANAGQTQIIDLPAWAYYA